MPRGEMHFASNGLASRSMDKPWKPVHAAFVLCGVGRAVKEPYSCGDAGEARSLLRCIVRSRHGIEEERGKRTV